MTNTKLKMDNAHEINTTITNFYLQCSYTGFGWDGFGCMAQCFGFCDKNSDDNTAMFWLLPTTLCTASRPFSFFLLFPSFLIPIIGWRSIRCWEGTQLELIFQFAELVKGYPLPWDIVPSNKTGVLHARRCWGPGRLILRQLLLKACTGIGLLVGGGDCLHIDFFFLFPSLIKLPFSLPVTSHFCASYVLPYPAGKEWAGDWVRV